MLCHPRFLARGSRDILPFIKHTEELEIWSNDYFLQLVDMIRFK